MLIRRIDPLHIEWRFMHPDTKGNIFTLAKREGEGEGERTRERESVCERENDSTRKRERERERERERARDLVKLEIVVRDVFSYRTIHGVSAGPSWPNRVP